MTAFIHTRAVCDACREATAALESATGIFLCASCAETFTEFEVTPDGRPSSVNAAASYPRPRAREAVATLSPGAARSSLPSGESEPTVTLASSPGESSSCGPLMREETPTALGAAADRIGRSYFGPLARGESLASLPPQDSIDPARWLPIPPDAPGNCGEAVEVTVSPLFSSADPGACGFDFEAEVSALEAEWARHGLRLGAVPKPPKYSATSRIRALRLISENLVHASSASDISDSIFTTGA